MFQLKVCDKILCEDISEENEVDKKNVLQKYIQVQLYKTFCSRNLQIFVKI